MAASPKKSLAVDSNLLLDLAEEKDFAHEFKEEFFTRGYSPFDENALLLAFNEGDLLPVHPAHPKNLLRALR